MDNFKSFQRVKLNAIDMPMFKEIRGKDYVSFGKDNMYPQVLIDLYNSSATHRTCVDAKRDATYGEGFLAYGDTIINTNQETLNELLEKIAIDYMLFEAYALNIIWNRAGDRVAEIYHLPVSNVRSGKMNEDDQVEDYYFSNNWANTRKYEPKRYPSFNAGDNRGDNASQIYYFHKYTPGSDIYAIPGYSAAINDIDLDKRISRFHVSNVSNGMFPGLMITLTNGEATPEEQQDIYRDLQEVFGGNDNAGKVFLSFVDSADRKPIVETIDSANDDYYIILQDRIMHAILTAHRITSPKLIGIMDSSGFSNNADEIQVSYAHFLSTVIEPYQKQIEKSMEWLLRFFGMNVNLKIKPAKLTFHNTVQTNPNQ
jgi:hypothetical protein